MYYSGFFLLSSVLSVTVAIKFSAESFSEIAILAKEGKKHLESINEKSNVPQFGQCWKNAVSDLQIGCKFLSENVQSDLALRFTDCFMQMSGHDPIVCDNPKICLQQLPDRAFNAYTEFYTHTQSICYFLQSQVWHEEAERTIDRLSSTSMHVSAQLEEAERTQEMLLGQQRESLMLQHDIVDSGKNISIALESSRDKISMIMHEFHTSTLEQKKALYDVFEKISSLKSWAVEEVSWLNSMFFYTSAVILSYLFTSASRTQPARIYIFLLLTINYFVEQYIYSLMVDKVNNPYEPLSELTEKINSWIWICRKLFISSSIVVTLVVALSYCDYNVLNYKLLLDIKDQNHKILTNFKSGLNNEKSNGKWTNISDSSSISLLDRHTMQSTPIRKNEIEINGGAIPLPYVPINNDYAESTPKEKKIRNSPFPRVTERVELDRLSVISERSEKSDISDSPTNTRSPYALRRSTRTVKRNSSQNF